VWVKALSGSWGQVLVIANKDNSFIHSFIHSFSQLDFFCLKSNQLKNLIVSRRSSIINKQKQEKERTQQKEEP